MAPSWRSNPDPKSDPNPSRAPEQEEAEKAASSAAFGSAPPRTRTPKLLIKRGLAERPKTRKSRVTRALGADHLRIECLRRGFSAPNLTQFLKAVGTPFTSMTMCYAADGSWQTAFGAWVT